MLVSLLEKQHIDSSEVVLVYIGNDLNHLSCLKTVGYSRLLIIGKIQRS